MSPGVLAALIHAHLGVFSSFVQSVGQSTGHPFRSFVRSSFVCRIFAYKLQCVRNMPITLWDISFHFIVTADVACCPFEVWCRFLCKYAKRTCTLAFYSYFVCVCTHIYINTAKILGFSMLCCCLSSSVFHSVARFFYSYFYKSTFSITCYILRMCVCVLWWRGSTTISVWFSDWLTDWLTESFGFVRATWFD